MPKFTDTKGRTWDVSITATDIKRIRTATDVDLVEAVSEKLTGLVALLDDPIKLTDVLFVLVEPQAKAQGIDLDELGSALSGDALAGAIDAFTEAVIAFQPNDRVRTEMRRLINAAKNVTAKVLDLVGEAVDRLDVNAVAAQMIPLPVSADLNHKAK